MAQKEKEKRKKNNTKYSGHFVSLQRLRAAHALRSDQLLLLWLRTAIRVEGRAFCSSFRAKIDFRNIRRAHALSVEQRFLCSYLILYPQVTSDISSLILISDHLLVLNCWVLATARSLSGPLPPFMVAANSGIINFSTSLIFGFYNATFITQFLLMMDIR